MPGEAEDEDREEDLWEQRKRAASVRVEADLEDRRVGLRGGEGTDLEAAEG